MLKNAMNFNISLFVFVSRNGLLRPNAYHYFSFFIFTIHLSQNLLIIFACRCILSFDRAVPFRFFLYFSHEHCFNFFPYYFLSRQFFSAIFNFSVSFLIYFTYPPANSSRRTSSLLILISVSRSFIFL